MSYNPNINISKVNEINDIKTYELYKEFKLNNETINTTFTWDSSDIYCYIESDLIVTNSGNINLYIRFNNDLPTSNSSTYIHSNINNSTNISSKHISSTVGGIINYGVTLNRRSSSISYLSLIPNQNKIIRTSLSAQLPDATNSKSFEFTSIWNNLDAVNFINLFGGTTTFTGVIRIYRRVDASTLEVEKLIHKQKYINEPVNINVDMSDCDSLRLKSNSITTGSSTNVGVVYNNDLTENYRLTYYSNPDSAGVFNTTGSITINHTNYSNCNSIMNIGKDGIIRFDRLFDLNNYNGFIEYKRSNITSVNILGDNFNGNIEIYKIY